jgi:F0F1-type ATP synthase membrane subunit c/vacuolar-type H+-ATPase subunit K
MYVYIELYVIILESYMNRDRLMIMCLNIAILLIMLSPAVYAAEADTNALVSKVFAATIAFAVAVAAAGFTISKAGSAGLAASAERPEVRTVAIIIAAFGEALAIYGIAIAFFILSA